MRLRTTRRVGHGRIAPGVSVSAGCDGVGMRTDNFLTLPFAPTADDTDGSPLRSRWEACTGFSPGAPGSQVCAECGWLAGEHIGGAVVRRLPSAEANARPTRRLAS
jgi:hypothetical protein